MDICLSELIKQATQCLVDLGLSPGTIKDYQCSAFGPLERRLKNQEKINSAILLAQEEFFLGQYQAGEISRLHTTGGSVAYVCFQKYMIPEALPGKYIARKKRHPFQNRLIPYSAVLLGRRTADRGKRPAKNPSAEDFCSRLLTVGLRLLRTSSLSMSTALL